MRYDTPCLKEDWKHAFLVADNDEHVFIDGIEMTAKNVWDYKGSREELVKKLVDFFYSSGIKNCDQMPDSKIENEIIKLVAADATKAVDADGSLKNTSRLCLDVCRSFCWKSFYATRTNGTASIRDVYADKNLLEKVLKNRLGWYTTTEPLELEDGTILEGEHPYLFDMSHNMLVQGCHSSMVSANVSNFRPLVAKFLMSKFCPNNGKVLDLSAGWGARMLAALSLGLSYYGIDPMTIDEISNMLEFVRRSCKINDKLKSLDLSLNAKLAKNVSEDFHSYGSFPDGIDYAIVCPPYFKLEEYDCEKDSTRSYGEYGKWLEKYWRQTVKNAKRKLKSKAKFTLIMVEKWGRLNLLEDMSSIVHEEGFTKVDEMSYKTTRSHLTDKRTSKNNSKSTEKVVTFENV